MRLASTLVALFSLAASFQAPQFKSGVQLLTIEASLRAKSGNPVTGLKPLDFTATIDGKPRTVVFAHYSHSEAGAPTASNDPAIGRYVTNADADASAGHVVVVAIDRIALPSGNERAILASAAAML